jgi:hypothetical protein
MACCGQARAQVSKQLLVTHQTENPTGAAGMQTSRAQVPGSNFQYVGKTALTALGLATGRQYRFPYPGAILQVDARDQPSLSSIPNLRQVS